MPIEIINTEIPGLVKIKSHTFEDDRGLYIKHYEINQFKEYGIQCVFTETSDIFSYKGALRGLHYQHEYSQAKLIHVISGIIYDVAVDLRSSSPTFGQVHSELLESRMHEALFIPEGFAHGFITLSEEAYFSYQCSGKYHPESCGGILWNDPKLGINWPLKEYGIEKIICTDKDKNWPTFEEYCFSIGVKR